MQIIRAHILQRTYIEFESLQFISKCLQDIIQRIIRNIQHIWISLRTHWKNNNNKIFIFREKLKNLNSGYCD